MRRSVAAIAILLAALISPAFADEVYPDLIYFDGAPQSAKNGRPGVLKLEAEQFQFCPEGGSCISTLYSAIRQQNGQTLTRQRKMMGLAGPNPLLLGASLALMALHNGMSKGKGPAYYNFLEVVDPSGQTRKISLLVPDEATQREIMNKIARYQVTPPIQRHVPLNYDPSEVIPLPRPADDPGYGAYEQELYTALMTAWRQSPVSARELKDDIQLVFKVAADGQIESVWVHQTSGNKNYDDAAIATLKVLSPLPALPDYYTTPPVTYAVFLSPQSRPEVSLDSYLTDVRQKALGMWKPVMSDEPVHIKVRLGINRDGSLDTSNIVASSGQPEMDWSVLTAVKDATPFPALPESFPNDTVTIELDFNYRFDTAEQP